MPRRAGADRKRIVLRLLCCVVIASAVITVWTSAALAFVLGPQLTSVCPLLAAAESDDRTVQIAPICAGPITEVPQLTAAH